MQSEKRIASEHGIVLALVLPTKRQQAVEALLDKYAQNGWKFGSSIFLITVDDKHVNSDGHARAAIRKQSRALGLVPAGNNVRYIILDDFKGDIRRGMDWVRYPEFIYTYAFKKLADDILEIKLKEWSLDWRAAVLDQVKKWQHDEIGMREVENWLRQFDKVSNGEFRWVGELLLRNFEVWSSQRVVDELEKEYGNANLPGQACIIRYENGKSGDSIAVMLRKKLSHLLGESEVLEYHLFLEKHSGAECVVFEDGAFTGVEIGDLIKSLLGIDGYSKCLPLTNKERMNSVVTTLHFAFGTDVGLSKITETVKALGLPISIKCGVTVPVLTPSGMRNLAQDTLYEKDEHGKAIFRDPDADIVPQAFVDSRWGQRRTSAINFCKKIGLQLFRSYQEKKGKFWSDRRLNECSLGTGNMAFLLAFSHSLPKSTMPFFWCHGEVEDNRGKKFNWVPLFPSAHRN